MIFFNIALYLFIAVIFWRVMYKIDKQFQNHEDMLAILTLAWPIILIVYIAIKIGDGIVRVLK